MDRDFSFYLYFVSLSLRGMKKKVRKKEKRKVAQVLLSGSKNKNYINKNVGAE